LRALVDSDSTLRDLAAGYLGRAFVQLGSVEESIPYFERAQAAEPEFVVDLADALIDLGRTHDAERVLVEASALGNVCAPLSLGNLREKEGRFDEAEHAFRRGIELGDLNSEFNLAHVLWTTGRTEEATSWLQSAAQQGDHLASRKLTELGLA
jgi:Flp pilus assembly protein TadD